MLRSRVFFSVLGLIGFSLVLFGAYYYAFPDSQEYDAVDSFMQGEKHGDASNINNPISRPELEIEAFKIDELSEEEYIEPLCDYESASNCLKDMKMP